MEKRVVGLRVPHDGKNEKIARAKVFFTLIRKGFDLLKICPKPHS